MTSLFGGGPFPKDAGRIAAYGEVDELNSVIGCALPELKDPILTTALQELQEQLFVLGAELATLNPNEKMKEGFLQELHVAELEELIDQLEAKLPPLKKFILPGGGKGAAFLHLARTTCRRAERAIVALSHHEPVRPEVLTYINRLSDLLFVMARFANLQEGVKDILWEGILK